MSQHEFIQKVKNCLFEESSAVDAATVLNDLDGWDSLGRLSIVVMLHDEFSLTVDTKTLRACETIGDLLDLVRTKLDN
jgi:acyl carrier protein